MDNFTAIRNGLDEHFEEGKFTPYDMGVYYVILRQCDWKTGIWKGSAAKIVAAYGFSPDLRDVQRSMHRLREIQMINYRDGRGQNQRLRTKPKIIGYHVENSISVETAAMDQVGSFIDLAISSGASPTRRRLSRTAAPKRGTTLASQMIALRSPPRCGLTSCPTRSIKPGPISTS